MFSQCARSVVLLLCVLVGAEVGPWVWASVAL